MNCLALGKYYIWFHYHLFSITSLLRIYGLVGEGGQSQQETLHQPGLGLASELLLDNVKVNDLASLPSHKHQWHRGETDGPLRQISVLPLLIRFSIPSMA